MKRLMSVAILLLFAVAAFAQEGTQMPKQGDIKYYTITSKTPMGTTCMSLKDEILYVAEDSIAMLQTFTDKTTGKSTQNTVASKIVDGVCVYPLKSMFSQHLSHFTNIQLVEGVDEVRYPIDFNEGAVMEPAAIKIRGTVQGMEVLIELAVKERKYPGKEQVTIPMGTFECLKYTENHVMSFMGQELVSYITCWYGDKEGLLKQTVTSMGGQVVTEIVQIETEQPL